jgi:hypothetical protein
MGMGVADIDSGVIASPLRTRLYREFGAEFSRAHVLDRSWAHREALLPQGGVAPPMVRGWGGGGRGPTRAPPSRPLPHPLITGSTTPCGERSASRWGRQSDPKYISTSYAERSNLSVRMHTRRFTRLTNAFSKKVENHTHSVALFAMYYNFVRVHKTLRMTPAMAANVTNRLWEMSDLVDVLEAAQ